MMILNSKKEFFVACILIGLKYLHNRAIIHRHIKPENLVLDHKGYVRITDFGTATSDTSGTPGYMGRVNETAGKITG